MNDIPDIQGIPPEQLRQVQGTASWTEIGWEEDDPFGRISSPTPIGGPGMQVPSSWTKIVSIFYMNRLNRWSISVQPFINAQDRVLDVTITQGYDETDTQRIEQTYGFKIGGNIFFLKASIDASLKMTDEIKRNWSLKIETRTHETYLAGVRYVTWQLLDEIHITRSVSTFKSFIESGPVGDAVSIKTDSDIVTCIIGTVEDRAP